MFKIYLVTGPEQTYDDDIKPIMACITPDISNITIDDGTATFKSVAYDGTLSFSDDIATSKDAAIDFLKRKMSKIEEGDTDFPAPEGIIVIRSTDFSNDEGTRLPDVVYSYRFSIIPKPQKELGWLYDQIFDANPERSTQTLIRRMGKLAEEYGELWEAFLNVTSSHNGKGKTWDDVREEGIDVAIVALDIIATRLPTDEGKTEEEMREEIIAMVNKKLEKWKVSSTAKTDAVSEEGSRNGKI